MVQTRASGIRRLIAVAAACSAMLLIGARTEPAGADHTFNATAVSGSAYGYFSSVSLFGGTPNTRGPTPTVTLPAGGSAAPITATTPTGLAQYGPAVFFSSGPLTVSTQGATGPGGSVSSSTTITNVNTSSQEVFTAGSVASSCTASGAGAGGSTTIADGTLRTSDETVVPIPDSPAPNTTYEGTAGGSDSFRYVFNEQIVNPDGSITVNAAHQYLLGPTAVGELIIGHSVCGTTATPIAHDTTSPPPAPPPPAPPTPAPPPPAPPPPGPVVVPAPMPSPVEMFPAKLQLQRAGVRGGKLDVLARVTGRATGRVDVSYQSSGKTTRFTAPITNGTIRIHRRLPSSQRRKRTGILTMTYAGNDRVRPDDVRLRAASGKALLRRGTTRIDGSGRLHVSGTISRQARGVVRIRLGHTAPDGSARFLNYTAKINNGTWSLTKALPADAANSGGQLSIQYTGYEARGIRGEQLAKAVDP